MQEKNMGHICPMGRSRVKFEYRPVSQYLAEKVKCSNFGDDCVPNGSTGKVATWGVPIYS